MLALKRLILYRSRTFTCFMLNLGPLSRFAGGPIVARFYLLILLFVQ